jgi:periplasmic copper chaperone A
MKEVMAVAACAMWLVGSSAGAVQQPVTASAAWISLPPAGETSATAFVLVDNPTMYDIYLVAATADAAGQVRFRERHEAGVRDVQEIAAPAYGQLELTPEGVHMVLSELNRPLKTGDTVTLTLVTDGGLTLTVSAPVR